jgi:predicted RNA-binding Zn-ribbon protein involved in translation (DUF1610 family)
LDCGLFDRLFDHRSRSRFDLCYNEYMMVRHFVIKAACVTCYDKTKEEVQMELEESDEGAVIFRCPKCGNATMIMIEELVN